MLCGKRPCYIGIKSKPICDYIGFNLNVLHSSKARDIFQIAGKKKKSRFTVIERNPLFVLFGRFPFSSAKDTCTIIGIDWTMDATFLGGNEKT